MLKKCFFFLFPLMLLAQQQQPMPPPPPAQQHSPEITPAAGPLGKRADVIIDAEFLYWYATVTNLSYATKYVLFNQGNTVDPTARSIVPRKLNELSWNWDKGVRAGLGVVTNHDGWDVYADWTYTYNSTFDSANVTPFPVRDLINTQNPTGTQALASPWFSSGTDSTFNRISSRWSLLFHQIDLELGRKFWISQRLSLRPFGGVRGHWSRMFFKVKGTFDARGLGNNPEFLQETARRTQKFWAVGLLGGLDSAWHITKNWSIFIDWAVALLYGPFDTHTRFQSFGFDANGQIISNFNQPFNHDDIYTLQQVYDLALGFRWELPVYNSICRVRFDAGWESHLWPSFNNFDVSTSASNSSATYLPANGDLTLSGLVLRGRVEF